MLNSPVLDIIISLVFTYFLLSLLVSAFNEFLVGVMRIRAKDLKNAIDTLLFDDSWKKISEKIYNSPFIVTLQKDAQSYPAYIPARNFALALIQILKDKNNSGLPIDLRRSIENSKELPESAKTLFLGLLDEAANDLNKFQIGIEKFYNDSMTRLSGWYKRKANRIVFATGLILVSLLNVDSFNIYTSLWKNNDLAQKISNMASDFIVQAKADSKTITVKDTATGQILFSQQINLAAIDDTSKAPTAMIQNAFNKTLYVNNSLSKSDLPIGWDDESIDKLFHKCSAWNWLIKILGLLLTTFAVYLGAPFWFDVLNKFVNFRSSGKKPAE